MDDQSRLDLRAYLTHPHPSVRVCAYLALGREADQAALMRDRALLLTQPPVSEILDAQYPEGYWMHRDLGISPRYRATVWQLLVLAQLGVGPVVTSGAADGVALPDPVRRAVEVVLSDNVNGAGALRLRQDVPSPALTAAVLWAIARLGATDVGDWAPAWAWATERVVAGHLSPAAAVWMTRAAVAWERPRWLSAYKPWRAMTWPAVATGHLTFPLALEPDLLATMEMACEIARPELIPDAALVWLRARRRPDGTWPLDHVPGRLWSAVGGVGTANPWVTVRALAVLTLAGRTLLPLTPNRAS